MTGGADAGRRAALGAIVDELCTLQIGRTFNQYAQGGGDDRDPRSAPSVRAANLRTYLADHAGAAVVAVAEAAGWRGARYSGIPLLSERLIDEAATPYRRTSCHPRGWAEASASVVRGVLRDGGWESGVLVWNAVPTHPAGATPHSNRPPRRDEVSAGLELLLRLLDAVQPAAVLAIGRTAAAALPAAAAASPIRHPARGGAMACREQLGAALARLLG